MERRNLCELVVGLSSGDIERHSEQFRKLFIGGLTPATSEEKLRKYYQQWGDLVDAVVMKDCNSGRSRGFGFVTYKEVGMVDEAQNNRPHEIDGKIVEAKRAMPREDSVHPEAHMTVTKLFVGGLKKDIFTKELYSYFSDFGTIVDCEIVCCKHTGESRGFGFIQFDDYDPVDKAILYKPHFINETKIDVKKALSKEEICEIKRKKHNSMNCNGGVFRGNSSSSGVGSNCSVSVTTNPSCTYGCDEAAAFLKVSGSSGSGSHSKVGRLWHVGNNNSNHSGPTLPYAYMHKYLNDEALDPSYYTGGYNSSGIFPKSKGCAGYYRSELGFSTQSTFYVSSSGQQCPPVPLPISCCCCCCSCPTTAREPQPNQPPPSSPTDLGPSPLATVSRLANWSPTPLPSYGDFRQQPTPVCRAEHSPSASSTTTIDFEDDNNDNDDDDYENDNC